MQTRSFVGLGVHEESISIMLRETARYDFWEWSRVPNTPDEIAKLATRLSRGPVRKRTIEHAKTHVDGEFSPRRAKTYRVLNGLMC